MQQRKKIAATRRPVTAWALAVALGVSGVVAVSTTTGLKLTNEAAPQIQPTADLFTMPFEQGVTTVLNDPQTLVDAITASLPINSDVDPGDPNRVVKQFHADDDFSLFALTWTGNEDIAAFVRSLRKDGTWSPWFTAQPATANNDGETNGTRMIYVEPTDTIQVSTARENGQPMDYLPEVNPSDDHYDGAVHPDDASTVPAAGGVPAAGPQDHVPAAAAPGVAPSIPGAEMAAEGPAPALAEHAVVPDAAAPNPKPPTAPAAPATPSAPAPAVAPPADAAAPAPVQAPDPAPAPAPAPVPAPPAPAEAPAPVAAQAPAPVEVPALDQPELLDSGVPPIEGDPVSIVPPLGVAPTPVPMGSPPAVTVAEPAAPAPAAPLPQPAGTITAVFASLADQPATPHGDTIQLTAGAADWAGIPQPMITRGAWAKNLPEPKANCTPKPATDGEVSAITVQQIIGGSNNYDIQDIPRMLQEVYKYDTQTLGHCDIDFNAIVDKNGAIWEGREGGLNKAVRSDATPGFNENTWSIGVLGGYEDEAPNEDTIRGIGELAGWRAHIAGIDPRGGSLHTSEGNNLYPKDTPVYVESIVYAPKLTGTAGNKLEDAMGDIRATAGSHYDAIAAGTFDEEANAEVEKAREQAQAEARRKQALRKLLKGDTTNARGTNALATLLGTGNGDGDDDSGSSGSSAFSSKDSSGSSGSSTMDKLLQKDSTGAVLKIAGSLLAIGVGVLIARGGVPSSVKEVGNAQIVPGFTLKNLPVLVTKIIDLGGNTKYARVWHAVYDNFGPVLGKAIGGEHVATTVSKPNSQVSWVPFQHGLIVDSPEAGTHAIWGAIGDAWAAQGFDSGPLGLPVNEEHRVADDLLRTDFQGGHITFNTTTGETIIYGPDFTHVLHPGAPQPEPLVPPVEGPSTPEVHIAP